MATRTLEHRWYQRLTDDQRREIDAWFATKGLTNSDVREARVTEGQPGCVLVIVKRGEDGRITLAGNRAATYERTFDDRPAAMQ